jgi:predicted nucleic acid-binding protein
VDRIFLDANVLFSAAWREQNGLLPLWTLDGVKLLSSTYAVEEARVNLPEREQRIRLASLVERIEIVGMGHPASLPGSVALPSKDLPILLSAIEAGATHLLTGDKAHFGRFFGRRTAGVLVLPPSEYLRRR